MAQIQIDSTSKTLNNIATRDVMRFVRTKDNLDTVINVFETCRCKFSNIERTPFWRDFARSIAIEAGANPAMIDEMSEKDFKPILSQLHQIFYADYNKEQKDLLQKNPKAQISPNGHVKFHMWLRNQIVTPQGDRTTRIDKIEHAVRGKERAIELLQDENSDLYLQVYAKFEEDSDNPAPIERRIINLVMQTRDEAVKSRGNLERWRRHGSQLGVDDFGNGWMPEKDSKNAARSAVTKQLDDMLGTTSTSGGAIDLVSMLDDLG
jgi:hypothetical protein